MNIFKDVLNIIGTAFRRMFGNWGTLLISLALYGGGLALCYRLIWYMELSTPLQVFLYLMLIPALIVVLFFVLQVLGLSYVRRGVGPVYNLKRAWMDFSKLLPVTLPLLVLAIPVGLYIQSNSDEAPLSFFTEPLSAITSITTWKHLVVDGLRFILLYIFIPVVAIQLWLSAISEGVVNAFKNFGRVFVRAVEPRAMLIYVLITGIFATLFYLILFTKTQWGSEWTELWLIGTRITISFLIIFVGWLLLLGSLAEWNAQRAMRELDQVNEPTPQPQPSENFVILP